MGKRFHSLIKMETTMCSILFRHLSPAVAPDAPDTPHASLLQVPVTSTLLELGATYYPDHQAPGARWTSLPHLASKTPSGPGFPFAL